MDLRKRRGKIREKQATRHYLESGIIDRINELMQTELCQDEIAEILNREGYRNFSGDPLNQVMIHRILKRAERAQEQARAEEQEQPA